MATQTYTILDNGVHGITIEESTAGSAPLLLTDAEFFALVAWLQSEGIIGTTNVREFVVRPQEEITSLGGSTKLDQPIEVL
ncbi:hypothetical protein [Phyllobacterium leguminum]|uniref:Uncharacterized protein n=1 Tax=Phyllobacterium leguminum TaxID=314237 RepID=A0A318T7Y7_9HYPH|nr:hypothetical protein [Phyllobacterium leguminum]PYE89598.1 hypothetical protein C7477_103106 [Phyllobacterium leguminum]